MTQKRIGREQKGVLDSLIRQGPWYEGCGWIWQNHSRTIKILESLRARGMVESKETPRGPRRVVIVYTATDTGKQAAYDAA